MGFIELHGRFDVILDKHGILSESIINIVQFVIKKGLEGKESYFSFRLSVKISKVKLTR